MEPDPINNAVEIALIKNDIANFKQIFSKLDVAIEKIGGVSGDIKSMLAVHEERIAVHDRDSQELYRQMEQHNAEVHGSLQEDIKELHSRVTTVNRELTANISSTEHKIMKSISELKDLITEDKKALEKRLSGLEKWRWMMVGAFVLLGLIISYFDTAIQVSSKP